MAANSAFAQGNNIGAISNYNIDQTINTQQEKRIDRELHSKPTIQNNSDIKPKSNLNNNTKINVKEIEVKGSTKISRGEILSITRRYKNKELTAKDVDDLLYKLTKLYKDQGYITSFFYLPKNNPRIKEGILSVKALEGIQMPVYLQQGKYYKKHGIKPRLNLKSRQVLNVNNISNDLARLNENPDLNLQVNLEKGDEFGQTKVKLVANDTYPWHLNVFTDNLGRDSVGKQRFGLGATHNNLLTFADTFYSEFSVNPDFSLNTFNKYEIPIGSKGTKLGMLFAYNRLWLRGNSALRPLDIQGTALTISPYISQELFRNQHWLVKADTGFAVKNSKTDLQGVEQTEFNNDRLRIAKAGLNVYESDRMGSTNFRAEASAGLDVFDAGTNAGSSVSRRSADSEFLSFGANVSRIQRLPGGAFDIFRAGAQYSPSTLTSLEQYQVGGAFTVRGYEEGALIGDSGFMLSNELRLPFFFIPDNAGIDINRSGLPLFLAPRDKNKYSRYLFKDNIHLVGFVDAGGVSSHGSGTTDNFAVGTGLGLRVNLTRLFVARFDVGVPLVNYAGRNNDDFYIHFGLDSRLF